MFRVDCLRIISFYFFVAAWSCVCVCVCAVIDSLCCLRSKFTNKNSLVSPHSLSRRSVRKLRNVKIALTGHWLLLVFISTYTSFKCSTKEYARNKPRARITFFMWQQTKDFVFFFFSFRSTRSNLICCFRPFLCRHRNRKYLFLIQHKNRTWEY